MKYQFKQDKLKILFVSESSYAGNTGFANYYKNLISRVHESGKYRCAEFASFAGINDPRDEQVKHRFYANEVAPNDPRHAQFQSNELNKLGLWRYEKVLLDFMPDVTIELRDCTMYSYQDFSHLRKYVYWIQAPAIDSGPQINAWLDCYLSADAILPYTDYGKKVLEEELHGRAKVFKVAYPGADYKTFFPITNKVGLRQKYGIDPNINIVGFCARNQIRKLFPNLMEAFRKFLDTQLHQQDYYLYLNTTHPDLKPWNFSKILVEMGLTNNVLFSYICTKCQQFFPNKWNDVNTKCRFCGELAIMPRISYMPTPQHLNEIYNLFDVYVQYANAGGAEFPLIEAAAAGTPVMAIDYAGMGSIVHRLGGVPLKTYCLSKDINTEADRAIPNNEHLVEELKRFFSRPKQINIRNGFKTHEVCLKKFSWDVNADIFMECIDNIQFTGRQGKWGLQEDYVPQQVPDNSKLSDYINQLIDLGLQEPRLKNTLFIDDLIKKCEIGIYTNGNGIMNTDKNYAQTVLVNLINQKIAAELIRKGSPLDYEDFMMYAETKELVNL